MFSRADLFKWRLWAGVFLPTVVSFGASSYFGDSLLGLALALSFCLTVGASFTRYMARSQTRIDLWVKLRHLQAEFNEVTELIESLPYEERLPYLDGQHLMALRIRALQEVLEAKK